MDLSFEQIVQLSPELARQAIPTFMVEYVVAPDEFRAQFLQHAQEALNHWSDDDLVGMLQTYAAAGGEYRLYPADPVARSMTRQIMVDVTPGAVVEGLERLRAAAEAGPCLLLCNHLSYVDTQLTDMLLATNGAEDLADHAIAIAGPKVYAHPFRRLAAISLNTLQTAQSASLSDYAAALSPSEVGRIAIQTIRTACDLMAGGSLIILYAEGTRSRSGRLQPFLRAASKYARCEGLRLVPVAQTGGEILFPANIGKLHPAPVRLAFCEPVEVASMGAAEAVTEAWRRVAAALPEAYQPQATTPPVR